MLFHKINTMNFNKLLLNQCIFVMGVHLEHMTWKWYIEFDLISAVLYNRCEEAGVRTWDCLCKWSDKTKKPYDI